VTKAACNDARQDTPQWFRVRAGWEVSASPRPAFMVSPIPPWTRNNDTTKEGQTSHWQRQTYLGEATAEAACKARCLDKETVW